MYLRCLDPFSTCLINAQLLYNMSKYLWNSFGNSNDWKMSHNFGGCNVTHFKVWLKIECVKIKNFNYILSMQLDRLCHYQFCSSCHFSEQFSCMNHQLVLRTKKYCLPTELWTFPFKKHESRSFLYRNFLVLTCDDKFSYSIIGIVTELELIFSDQKCC